MGCRLRSGTAQGIIAQVVSNGITLKQTEAVISLVGRYLAQREVVEEGRSTVRLPEGEGRGTRGNFEASTTVLGCNLGLKGPPVLWVRVQSLKGRKTTLLLQTTVFKSKLHIYAPHLFKLDV